VAMRVSGAAGSASSSDFEPVKSPAEEPPSLDLVAPLVDLSVACALVVVAVATTRQQLCSSTWHTFQGAWSMQRQGDGSGSLQRLLGEQLPSAADGDEEQDTSGQSWCPNANMSGSGSICAKVSRLIRLGRPDALFIGLGISGFVRDISPPPVPVHKYRVAIHVSNTGQRRIRCR
jgi:hypothetical protein